MNNTPFDLTPVLTGALVRARPLVADDFMALAAAASDPLLWAQHPDPERWRPDVFRRNVFDGALECGSAFTIIDLATNAVIGTSRYYGWDESTREVSIGYTFFVRTHWGGRYNGELKQLMLDHAFRWADRVWFHIGADNMRSRRAVEKVGATFDSVSERDFNGVAVPYAYYVIERHAWENRR